MDACLLSLPAVASYLSISLSSVRRMVLTGELPVVRIGGVVRVRKERLDEWVKAKEA